MKKRLVLLLALGLATLIVLSVPFRTLLPKVSRVSAAGPYNIVFILTDDQRWDTLCNGTIGLAGVCDQPQDTHPMPTVESELLAKGSLFTNAVVSDPLCCPSRASILSGGFNSDHTNVEDVALPNGSFAQFKDATSLGTLLQQNGYKTALIGKYLNGYGAPSVSDPNYYAPQDENDQSLNIGPRVISQTNAYVPPGWDRWVGLVSAVNWNHNFTHVVGSSSYDQASVGTPVTTTDGTYLTDFQRDQALTFIDDTCPVQACATPFFLYFAPFAPHYPATPAPRHVNLFSSFLYRGRGYDETDMSDKPAAIQQLAATQFDPAFVDDYARKHLASLRAVDEAVAAILASLTQKNLLDNTVFIFASDNGYLWGEHELIAKDKAYEESLRVPLIVRVPNGQPQVLDQLVAMDLDVPPTILDLAGITPLAADGMSLVPLLSNPLAPWRTDLLIQGSFQLRPNVPTWAGIRTADNWKYVEYSTGERELYNLAPDQDPYELSSKQNDPAYQAIMADLAARLDNLRRGIAINTYNLPNLAYDMLPNAFNGQPYSFQFGAWGGNGNYVWDIYIGPSDNKPGNECAGGPPAGLTLSRGGLLSGTPLSTGVTSFCVRVQDTSVSPQPGNGRPQSNIRIFSLNVVPAATATPTATTIITRTATPTRKPSRTATPTITLMPSPSATATATASATPTPSATPTASGTAVATETPTPSATPTETATETPMPSATSTATATSTPTPAATATASTTSTPNPSATPSVTATSGIKLTPSPTRKLNRTPTPTIMFTSTPTARGPSAFPE